MVDAASINRSLSTIQTELEFLRESGVLLPAQYQSITAQLPHHGGQPSPYVDTAYGGVAHHGVPGAIAQASQDPNHPAHPNHPQHHEWAKRVGGRLGNAALWGVGATAGADLVNHLLR